MGLESPAVRKKMELDTMKSQRTSFEISSSTNGGNGRESNSAYNPIQNDLEKQLRNENESFVRNSQQSLKLMQNKQEEHLEALSKGIPQNSTLQVFV